jgi:glycine betaine/choline ABC-type transport system substrate-binding protein/ABC-type proline/glycine betaine transport system permease subunit
MTRLLRLVWLSITTVALLAPQALAAKTVVVGSKRFTESYILGEIVSQTLVAAGVAAVHRQGLGNTGILVEALASGAVDVYPEYTGTIAREILGRSGNPSLAQLDEWLAPRGLKVGVPLGFNNTYALAMREGQAEQLGVARISDLARLAPGQLRLGLSHEFVQRADGWQALRRAYGLPQDAGAALDHGLAYEALRRGQVDLIDAYSTDAQLGPSGLRVLVDDRGVFPRYDAVLLMRASLDAGPLLALRGRIDDAAMRAMNAQAEIDGVSFAQVAHRFLAGLAGRPDSAAAASPSFVARLFAPDLPRLVGQHLALVFGSLAMAVVIGIPLGIAAWRRPALAAWLLGGVGVLQTVPSLALLAFLIALLGVIGFWPALLALALYALLPIVRNTHAGLVGVAPGMTLAAAALGLTPRQALWAVQLPLAGPTLLAGVKTAAVINVGTATVAAFIGAGGLGERIVAGLAVNDSATMLAGALPAAVLALAVQWFFDAIEKRLRH